MARRIHFEIHADDPLRAKAFYETTFGWTIQKWEGGGWDYWLIGTGPKTEPGIDGGLLRRRGPRPTTGAPVNAFVVTVGVADVDATLTTALASGATVAAPKITIPGIGFLVYIHDSEGNILGMMQEDPGAK